MSFDRYELKTDSSKDGLVIYNAIKLLDNPKTRTQVVQKLMADISAQNLTFDVVAGIASRGYSLAMLLATEYNCPMIHIRKTGKLPETAVETISYKTEYSIDSLCVLKTDVVKGSRVLLVDDVLATGGTFLACRDLLKRMGVETVGATVILSIGMTTENYDIKTIAYKDLAIPDHIEFTLAANEKCVSVNNEKPFVVMSGPTMEYFVQNMLRVSKMRKGYIDWNNFPDGWPDIKFDANLRDSRVIFIVSSNVKEMFKELSVLKVLPRQEIQSLDIVVPYFAPGTMERVEKEGVLATAETFAKMLSDIQSTQNGLVNIHLFDVHALPERFYFGPNVHIKMHTAISQLIMRIRNMPITICFPDEGATKRFGGLFKGFPIVTCSKVRQGEKRVITVEDFDISKPASKHVIIVDDICHSGNTLYETYKVLKTRGVERVDLYTTHAPCENGGYLDFLRSGPKSGIDTFYTTDSTPTSVQLSGHPSVFTILPLSEQVVSTFGQIDTHWYPSTCTVAVGSTSAVKLRGIAAAFTQKFPNTYLQVLGYKVKSGVPEQPREDQILQGAHTRMSELVKTCTTSGTMTVDCWVTVESGIIADTEMTLVMINDGKNFKAKMNKVYKIPSEFIPNNEIFPNLTAGTLIAKKYGCSNDDWYTRFGTLERWESIRDTCLQVLTDSSPPSQAEGF